MTLDLNKIKQKKLSTSYGIKSNGEQGISVKDVDLTKRIVTGFYNTAMFFDSDFDVSLPGSNTKSIQERGPQSSAVGKIKHLKGHNWNEIPGTIITLEERSMNFNGINLTGTYFETKMVNTTLGNDSLINYQEGIIDNHSFGFKYMDIEMIDQDSSNWKEWVNKLVNPQDAEKAGFMFLVKEYKMYEGSQVGLGANQLTPYLGVKSGNPEAILLKVNERFDLLTKQLRSGTQSDETMYQFEMELKQLRQITNELFDHEPSIKDTLIQSRDKDKEEGRSDKDTFDLDAAIKTVKFFN